MQFEQTAKEAAFCIVFEAALGCAQRRTVKLRLLELFQQRLGERTGGELCRDEKIVSVECFGNVDIRGGEQHFATSQHLNGNAGAANAVGFRFIAEEADIGFVNGRLVFFG